MVQHYMDRRALAGKAWQTALDDARKDLIGWMRAGLSQLGEHRYAGSLDLGPAAPYAQHYHFKNGRPIGDFPPGYGGERPVSPGDIPFEQRRFYPERTLLQIARNVEHALRSIGRLPPAPCDDSEL